MIEIMKNLPVENPKREGIRMDKMEPFQVGRAVNAAGSNGNRVMRTGWNGNEVIDLDDPESGSWTDLKNLEDDIRVVLFPLGEEVHLRLFNEETL